MGAMDALDVSMPGIHGSATRCERFSQKFFRPRFLVFIFQWTASGTEGTY